MNIYIGKIKFDERVASEFDTVYCSTNAKGVIEKVRAEWLTRVEDDYNAPEYQAVLEQLRNVDNADELSKWFKDNQAAFQFELRCIMSKLLYAQIGAGSALIAVILSIYGTWLLSSNLTTIIDIVKAVCFPIIVSIYCGVKAK